MAITEQGVPVRCPFCRRSMTNRRCTGPDGCHAIICSECDRRPGERTGEHEVEDHIFPELERIAERADEIEDDTVIDPGSAQ